MKRNPSKRKTKTSKHIEPFAPGPRTVRVWFDTVLNPILQGLTNERSLLLKRNWTWQFRPAFLESIRPVEHYIDSAAQANLQQFLEFHPSVETLVKEHDKLIALLNQTCSKLHDMIVTRSSLSRLYAELTSEESLRVALEKHGRSHISSNTQITRESLLSDIFGGYPPSDHMAVIAQYIVNNSGDLPNHITIAPFWNEYRERLLTVLHVPQIAKQYTVTTREGARLMQESDALTIKLQEIRRSLSVEHDVPYVDPSSAHSENKWSLFR